MLLKEYNGNIQPHMDGLFSNLVAKTFKVITRKKLFIPVTFAKVNQQVCIKCTLGVKEGHLYPLEKQFIFIHKSAVLIRFKEIELVEFKQSAGGQVSTHNFNLSVTINSIHNSELATREYTFSGFDESNYTALFSFLSGKKIYIANNKGVGIGMDEHADKLHWYQKCKDCIQTCKHASCQCQSCVESGKCCI
jgi:structure-specific recognition protein 1